VAAAEATMVGKAVRCGAGRRGGGWPPSGAAPLCIHLSLRMGAALRTRGDGRPPDGGAGMGGARSSRRAHPWRGGGRQRSRRPTGGQRVATSASTPAHVSAQVQNASTFSGRCGCRPMGMGLCTSQKADGIPDQQTSRGQAGQVAISCQSV